MIWMLLYLMSGSPMANIGPFKDKASCEAVQVQIEKSFKPKKADCISIVAVLP